MGLSPPRLIAPPGALVQDEFSMEEADLAVAGKTANITVFEGADHAFFNDTRTEVYDADLAAACWTRMLTFYREHVT